MTEFTESDGIYAVMKNISETGSEYLAVLEKRMAHVFDAAHIAREKLRSSYGDAPLLELLFSSDDALGDALASVPKSSHAALSGDDPVASIALRELEKFDMLCYCKALSAGEKYDAGDVSAILFGRDGDADAKNKKIAMLRTFGSGKAFELFAAHVRGVEAIYADNFKSVCDAVYLGEAALAVLPLESSTDGRLDGLYVMMEKYGLNVLMSCDVVASDGSVTRFALVGRPCGDIPVAYNVKFEFRISLSDTSEISEISDAAEFFSARLDRVDNVPLSYGRDNAHGMIVDMDGADTAGFMTYMEMRFSQFVAVGIYSHITEE